MRILLDANAYTYYMHGNAGVVEVVERAEEIVLSPVVVGELLYGFGFGSRVEWNLDRLRQFLESPAVSLAEIGLGTAERYGEIVTALRRKGRLIPTNDMWIAAHAMETGADLVSADSHFGHVDGLAWTRLTPA